ncbi:MAG TPA: MBL fold metallo-hydrolase [Bryobacteraceae bacterium]|nr:MBL fold metallo-hydrolase [Bryobacteraceae bacterium]
MYQIKGGSGANTAFLVGKTSVTVIDSKMTEDSTKAVLAEIRKVTPNPVGMIILTHSDGDHVNGLNGFPKGLKILAHANCRREMEEAFKDPKMAALIAYLPNETITADRSIDADGIRVELRYFGPAHTSGDIVVFLPEQKIAIAGDLLFLGRDPLIHRQKGGSSLGLVRTLNGMLALDADTFLSGHNDPITKAEIKTLVSSIEEKQAKVKALAGQGRSLDEIKQAMGVASAPGGQAPRFPSLVEIIYQEVTAKQ